MRIVAWECCRPRGAICQSHCIARLTRARPETPVYLSVCLLARLPASAFFSHTVVADYRKKIFATKSFILHHLPGHVDTTTPTHTNPSTQPDRGPNETSQPVCQCFNHLISGCSILLPQGAHLLLSPSTSIIWLRHNFIVQHFDHIKNKAGF
jgi:hypothetical protein